VINKQNEAPHKYATSFRCQDTEGINLHVSSYLVMQLQGTNEKRLSFK